MKQIYIIGSKGIPANYGGFETFVERLTEGRRSEHLRYHVSCIDRENRREEYNGADCFHLKIPDIGPAKAVYYDRQAFCYALSDIRKNQYRNAVIYVLACRIGPFMKSLVRRAHALGASVYVNPDGHEFMRAKWNGAIKQYWKYSEKLMVKQADLMICDAKEMERYIREEYAAFSPKTTYLAYGADLVSEGAMEAPEAVAKKEDPSKGYEKWLTEHGLTQGEYALCVGRFVPENNFETMIREYMSSSLTVPLVLICNVEENRFCRELRERLSFERDERIRFVGTVYDRLLLQRIRQGALVYLHGHEVGGTNPTLLEALAATRVNLLLDVPFSREVGEDGALYWSKDPGSLRALLEKAVNLSEEEKEALGEKARKRIREHYLWEEIIRRYEELFLSEGVE